MKVPFILKKFLFCLREPFLETHTANICGHETKQEGFIHNDDFCKITIMEMPLTENGHPDYCLECIGNMSTHCAWCGKQIFIGDQITLYALKEGANVEINESSVSYELGGLTTYVGCVSCYMGCTDIYSSGCWLPGPDGKGMVELHLSIYQQMDKLEKELWSNPTGTLEDKGGRLEPTLHPLKQ